MGQDSEFVRTPKNGELKIAGSFEVPVREKKYLTRLPNEKGLQLLTSGVFIFAAGWVVQIGNWYMVPFLMLLAVGFSLSAVDNYIERKVPH